MESRGEIPGFSYAQKEEYFIKIYEKRLFMVYDAKMIQKRCRIDAKFFYNISDKKSTRVRENGIEKAERIIQLER